MIVRIATESQYKLADDVRDRLNEIDNQVVAAVERDDEPEFHNLYDAMLALVRAEGNELDGEELVESDVILPPPDLTFAEAQTEFTGEGLIPG